MKGITRKFSGQAWHWKIKEAFPHGHANLCCDVRLPNNALDGNQKLTFYMASALCFPVLQLHAGQEALSSQATSALLQRCISVRSLAQYLSIQIWRLFVLKKTTCPHWHSSNNTAPLFSTVLGGKNNSPECKELVPRTFPFYFANTVRFICSNVSLPLWQLWKRFRHCFPPAQKKSVMAKQTEKVQPKMRQVW